MHQKNIKKIPKFNLENRANQTLRENNKFYELKTTSTGDRDSAHFARQKVRDHDVRPQSGARWPSDIS